MPTEPGGDMEIPKTVLICDDKFMNRKLVIAMLTGLPYQVIEATCGQDCLQRMDTDGDTVDIILLDISMKDINGIDVCRELRNKPYGAHIPIVAYTANAMSGERAKFIEAGFNEVLIKPIVEEELLLVLDRLLAI